MSRVIHPWNHQPFVAVRLMRFCTAVRRKPPLDAVGVQNTGDTPFVVVTAEHPGIRATIRWLVRANQGHTRAVCREVPRRGHSHQALPHDDILVMPLGHVLPPLASWTLLLLGAFLRLSI